MAANFQVVNHERSIRVMSPTLVVDVERVGFFTRPSGVYAEYPVPLDDWAANGPADVIGPLATQIESIIGQGFATGASFAQDFDNNGLLTDYLDFIVTYVPPGGLLPPQTTTVRVACDALIGFTDVGFQGLPGAPDQLILTAWERLQADMSL